MRLKTPILGLIAAIAAAGCTTEVGRVADDADPAAHGAVEACSPLGDQARQDCYQERLLAKLAVDGVRPTLDLLEDIAAADMNVEREAHVYTHAIGITAYDSERPVAEVFVECTELFQSGCYHGVIQAHFMASGAPGEETVRGLCQPFKDSPEDKFVLFQCLHGLGHGLTMFYGHHLPRALEDCDLLADNWDRESCYGGAFMENIVAAVSPHHVATELARDAQEGDHGDHGHEMAMATDVLEPFEPLRAEDPHYPCSILDARYLTSCYLMQTSAMLHHNGGDFRQVAEDCGEAPENWRKTCFQSLGRDVSAYTLQDHGQGLEACQRTPAEYREWCYVGLVKNFVDLTADTADGFEFCTKVEDEFKPRCNEALGEQIGTLFGSADARRDACARAESETLVRSCLYGARVPTGD